MLKGMILAAGRGTRLGPLTDNIPKPLLPVANRPVMCMGIECLQRLGISEICANVSYYGEQIIESLCNGNTPDAELHWLHEREPTGTAGGVKGMQKILGDDTFVIIAGDAMLDIDLNPLVRAHRAHGAFATIATVHVADPSHYGVVVTDETNRVLHFQEKPPAGTEISHQANTGIYIFEPGIFDLIPAGTHCDFALNVFPEILARGLPFYALPVEGYWTDIGNPGEYLQANRDYLSGRIRVHGRGQRINSSLIAHDAHVAGSTLQNCVIGDRVALPPGCDLHDCVIWPDAVIHTPLQLRSAVLTAYGHYQIDGKGIQEITQK